MNMARSTFYKRPHAGHRAAREKADTDLRVRIEDILAEFPAYGYRRVTHELRRRQPCITYARTATQETTSRRRTKDRSPTMRGPLDGEAFRPRPLSQAKGWEVRLRYAVVGGGRSSRAPVAR